MLATLLLTPLLLAIPVRERAPDDASWIGKTVFMRIAGLNLDLSPEPNDMPMRTAPANAIQYRVLGERPKHILVKTREGLDGWLHKGDVIPLEDAVPFFTKQINDNRNDSSGFSRRASAYRSLGDLDSALKDASEAIRLNPHAANYNNRALIWHAKRDYEKAIADYAQAISKNPQYTLAHVNRATMWLSKKDYDKVIDDTSQALQWEPKNPTAFRLRGNAWFGNKDHDRALKDLGNSLQVDPKSSQTFADRAAVYAARGHHALALADFNEALRLEPTNTQASVAAALWLASCPEPKFRDGKRALELALTAQRRERSNTRALEALAAAYAELGRFADAVAWQEHALHDTMLREDVGARGRLELYRQKRAYRK